MTYDEDDERGANLPDQPVSKAALILAALASIGVAIVVYGLYSLVALAF